ncbi:hypothetical protein C8T65DRAFT_744065 [Cerioporus squamosus]|nr:hypothetical protein C8T65DRAFT_744065 [Cerioporus squamosus]
MSIFLPLVDTDLGDDALLSALARIGPLVLPSSHSSAALLQNASAEKVILPLALAKELICVVPEERMLLLLDIANVSAVSDRIRSGVSGVLIKTPSIDVDFSGSFSRFFAGSSVHVLPAAVSEPPSRSTIHALQGANTTLVIPTSLLTLSPTDSKQINVADALLVHIAYISDRQDGLLPTVVSSYPDGGRTLGLVYSA